MTAKINLFLSGLLLLLYSCNSIPACDTVIQNATLYDGTGAPAYIGTLAITGDVSFFYDTNAFFNNNLPNNLKVIVVNNSGGGIFRFIPGPDTTEHLEDVFESKHHANVEGVAKAHNVKYIGAKNKQELLELLPEFLSDYSEAAILEINTPDKTSAELLRHYFKALKNG